MSGSGANPAEGLVFFDLPGYDRPMIILFDGSIKYDL